MTHTNRNQEKNNFIRRTRPTFTLYNNDSSSDDSSETESDITSSDSSEEDYKRRVIRGGNYGRPSKLLTKNGANSVNGARSTSAKINDKSKRGIHTQRNISSPGGSITGRSVKSESAITATLTQRRVESKKPPLPKVNSKTDGKPPVKKDAFSGKVKNGKTQETSITNTVTVTKAEKDKVLKKYGLSPLPAPENQDEIRTENQVETDSLKKLNIKVLSGEDSGNVDIKPVRSDSAIASGYFVDDLVKQTVEKSKPKETDSEEHQEEKLITFKQTVEKSKLKETDLEEEKLITVNKATVKTLKADENDIFENPGHLITSNKADSNTHEKNIAENSLSANTSISENVVMSESNEEIKDKTKELTAWHDVDNSTDKILHMLDSLNTGEKHRRHNHPGLVSSRSSEQGSNKGTKSKTMSDKAAVSFAKYANMSSGKNIVGKFSRRESGKGYRVTLRDKPFTNTKQSNKKSELKTVNPIPYGYARRQANKVKGVGPFHRINVRALNSSIDYKLEDALRSGSADIPKISYRHKTETPRNFDAQLFGMKQLPSPSPDHSDPSQQNGR